MRNCIMLLFLVMMFRPCFSQSIGINSDGSTPHPSAMLDIKSNSKGIIIPRVSLQTETDITTISNPATSLLVYNTNTAMPDGVGFHYWNGNKWTRLLTNTNAINLIAGSAWGMNGNNTADTNFIGTTNNQPLIFKVNDILSGKIDPGPNNVFFGQHAGEAITTGVNNTFLGHLSGQFSTSGGDNLFAGHNAGNENTTGNANVFLGQDAGRRNISGSLNVFIGEDAGIDNVSGSENTFIGNGAGRESRTASGNIAIGLDALSSNVWAYSNIAIGNKALFKVATASRIVAIGDSAMFNTISVLSESGGSNTAIGSKALFSNTTAYNNTAVGSEALRWNTTGLYNTAVGSWALKNNTGSNNTALGTEALLYNYSGGSNVAIGDNALKNNDDNDENTAVGSLALASYSGSGNTGVGFRSFVGSAFYHGDNNTAIGALAGPIANTLENTSCIGYQANVTTDNTMVFGNDDVDRWAFGIPTTNAQHALEVGEVVGDGNGAYLTQGGVWTNASDVNKKEDFSSLNKDDLMNKIISLPILRWKYKGSNEYHIGPMAQDFYKLFQVGVDDKGISTIDPAGISLAAIQILIKENQELKKELEEIKKLLQSLLK